MGRVKGARVHSNNGLAKRCSCKHKQWSECLHPWWFNQCTDKKDRRFNLTKHYGLSLPMARTEAARWRDLARTQIAAGKFDAPLMPATPPEVRRLRDVGAAMVDAWRNDPARRPHRVVILEKQLAVIYRTIVAKTPESNGLPFGDVPIDTIGREHLSQFRDARRQVFRDREAKHKQRQEDKRAGKAATEVVTEIPLTRRGEVGINRSLETVRNVLNFAIDREWFKGDNPFTRYSKKIMTKEHARTRRLQPDEEQRLLAALADSTHGRSSHERQTCADVIVAALDTGCRKGELLTLRWSSLQWDMSGQPRALAVDAAISKTNTARTVPILSERLRAILLRRRVGPDGERLPADAFVFGNEVGERILDVKRAWLSACAKAGIEGLNFHDLRREAASRWLEGGVRLLTVSALLGHTQVTTTNTYLASSPAVAEEELRAFFETQRAHGSADASEAVH